MTDPRNALFESAPIPRAFFVLTLPTVLGKVVMLVYNLADTYFIAAAQDESLVAGVSLAAPVFMLFIAIGDIFGVGGSSVVSRMFGRAENEQARRVSAFCFYAAAGAGVLAAALLLALQTPVLSLLGADAQTMPHAAAYYRWIVLGAPVMSACVVPLNLLRTEGMSVQSMAGSVTGSVVNLILDPILILGLGMGAAGAAIATVIGNICSLLVYLFFYRRARYLSAAPGDCRVRPQEAKQVFAIGIPACLTNLMSSLCMALTNRCLLPFGNDKIAALGIVSKISMVANMLLVGFAFGSQPLVGYNYGQGNARRLGRILRFIYTFQVGLAAVLSVLLGLLAPQLVCLFLQDAAIVAVGAQILRRQLLGLVFVAVVLVSACVFQATGKALAALALTISRQGVLFAAILWVAMRFGYLGIISVQPISDGLTACLAAGLLYTGLGRELRTEKAPPPHKE